MGRSDTLLRARAREIFDLRVQGCQNANKHRACTLLGRVSRVSQGCNGRPTPALPA